MRKYYLLFITIIFATLNINGQIYDEEEQAIEIFLIDSYVTPEPPHKFILTFFTSDSCTSKILIEEEYLVIISEEFTDNHKSEMDFTSYHFDTTYFRFKVIVKGIDGIESESELYEVTLPHGYEINANSSTNYIVVCCFGGIIFGLPSPTLVLADGEKYFGLSKEIPVLSFYTSGYNYPSGYVGIEYSYIFKSPSKNFLRVGYKHIIQTPILEYVSPGLNVVTDFKGFNGFSPEISVGWFKVYNVFTVYTKYRFSFKPSDFRNNFHDLSIGLFSNFFSLKSLRGL